MDVFHATLLLTPGLCTTFSVEQDCLFRTLSGILSLGNAEFDESPDESGHECAYITESYIADRVSELFGEFRVCQFLIN